MQSSLRRGGEDIPGLLGREFAKIVLGNDADLATPFAHFVASRLTDCYHSVMLGEDGRDEVRAKLAEQWSELSEAEKAEFTSPPFFASSAGVDASAGVDTAERSREGRGHDDASTSPPRRPPPAQPLSPAQAHVPDPAHGAAADGIDDATGTGYYGKQLLLFVKRTIAATGDKVFSWVQSEYDGDLQRLRADADRGDSMAQLGMAYGALGACVRDSNSGYERADQVLTWLDKACAGEEYRPLATPSFFMIHVFLQMNVLLKESVKGKLLLPRLKDLIEVLDGGTGSAELQHLVGLIECARAKPSAREDILEAARYIRAAAHLGLRDAEFELGEMFRKGAICDVKMRLARLYLKRAKKQGHPEAIQRMHELCSCLLCGAERAPLKCSTCLETRYCDSKCSAEHWRGGGGVSEVCEALLPHRDTCPRTYEDPAYDYE